MTFTAAARPFMARTRSKPPAYEPTPASRALKLRRTELGKSQSDVAFDSEVLTQTTVSELERGKYGPEALTAARLAALAKGLGWTVAELERATGLDLRLTAVIDSVVTNWDRAVLVHPDTVRSSERVRIPVYALAAAGVGTWTDDEVVDYIEVEPDVAYRRNRTTFQVDGDSMEPTLSSGDYIHVDIADQDIRDNKIYVIKVKGNGIVVKRARVYEDGTVSLLSDNPRHPPLRPDDAVVIGRVFGYNQAFRPL